MTYCTPLKLPSRAAPSGEMSSGLPFMSDDITRVPSGPAPSLLESRVPSPGASWPLTRLPGFRPGKPGTGCHAKGCVFASAAACERVSGDERQPAQSGADSRQAARMAVTCCESAATSGQRSGRHANKQPCCISLRCDSRRCCAAIAPRQAQALIAPHSAHSNSMLRTCCCPVPR